MKRLAIALLFLSSITWGQNFSATADNRTAGTVFQHLADTRISTSTDSGFTSPAALYTFHLGGKTYTADPDNSVMLFGAFQFGTGSLLSGDLNGTAIFGSDQSYVTMSSNGACGAFNNAGNCKVGFTTPQTNTLFVGVFLGNITLMTNLDGSKVIQGVVRGHVNGATATVDLNFTAHTAVLFNGQLNIIDCSVQPF